MKKLYWYPSQAVTERGRGDRKLYQANSRTSWGSLLSSEAMEENKKGKNKLTKPSITKTKKWQQEEGVKAQQTGKAEQNRQRFVRLSKERTLPTHSQRMGFRQHDDVGKKHPDLLKKGSCWRQDECKDKHKDTARDNAIDWGGGWWSLDYYYIR